MNLILQCVLSSLRDAGLNVWSSEDFPASSWRNLLHLALDDDVEYADFVQVHNGQVKYYQYLWLDRMRIPCVVFSVLCSDPECVDRVVKFAVARRDAGYPTEDVED